MVKINEPLSRTIREHIEDPGPGLRRRFVPSDGTDLARIERVWNHGHIGAGPHRRTRDGSRLPGRIAGVLENEVPVDVRLFHHPMVVHGDRRGRFYMPAHIGSMRRARLDGLPRVTATIGGKAPSQLGINALLDFQIEVALDGERLLALRSQAAPGAIGRVGFHPRPMDRSRPRTAEPDNRAIRGR